MGAMRRVAVVALCAVLCALGASACGGSSGSATGVASGAEVSPADALGFVSIDTDRGSEQWKQGDALLKKFPFRTKLLDELNRGVAEEGLDLDRDILPALGPELDLVFVEVAGKPQTVALTQPPDEQKFDALLAKSKEPAKQARIGDWTAFSDNQAAIDAVRNAGDHLDGNDAFGDAMDELPDEANAKAFVNGAKLSSTIRAAAPELTNVPVRSLEWAAVALSSHEEGWKLDGAWKTKEGSAHTYSPTLLDEVPAGSLLVASFKGSDQAYTQLRNTPQGQQALGQLQQVLGVGFDQLIGLVSDEGVLYVQKGAPFPEATIVLKEKNASAAMRTLNTIATRAAMLFGARPVKANASGSVKKLSFGRFALYYGVDRGHLVISSSIAPFGRTVSTTIEHDPVFEKAKGVADVPDETSGFLYVNVQDAVPVIASRRSPGRRYPPRFLRTSRRCRAFSPTAHPPTECRR
jgi:hypothetical protein